VPNALRAKRFGAIGFQTAIILGPVVALGRRGRLTVQPYRTTPLGSAALAVISSGLYPVIKIPPIKNNEDND
jgi:hypothetical protein